MHTYALTTSCRREYLLIYLGDSFTGPGSNYDKRGIRWLYSRNFCGIQNYLEKRPGFFPHCCLIPFFMPFASVVARKLFSLAFFAVIVGGPLSFPLHTGAHRHRHNRTAASPSAKKGR